METSQRERVFRDPVHGYIHVKHDTIKALIDSQAFQRLRRIRQLSGVQMVFHGAEHSRFNHSLGVYELANRFLNIPDIKEALDERKSLLFLAAALLHDIGHGPYSHAFEDVFKMNHELISARIILENKEIRMILDQVDDTFAEDVASIIKKQGKFPLIEQLISSQLDVDRLDYLGRDAYYTGVTYGAIDIDRLMRTLRVIDGKVVFKLSGIHAIENYLISRYHMYWQVYYHPVSRAYEVILEGIYERVRDLLNEGKIFDKQIEPLKRMMANKDDLDAYMHMDDFYINGLIAGFKMSDDLILKTLAHDFLDRNIWSYLDITEENKQKIESIQRTLEHPKYFSKARTVEQSAYKDNNKALEEIYILLENDQVESILKQSKIMNSLLISGTKSDLKFFYRKL